MAFAPASTVAATLSSVGPPVAMMGTFGKSARMSRTSSGVFSAADTLSMAAPGLDARVDVHVAVDDGGDDGNVDHLAHREIVSFLNRHVDHHAERAVGFGVAREQHRARPFVTPPPTPQNTGMELLVMMACAMRCCGVKG